MKFSTTSDGILLVYDISRSKWISIDRSNFYFGFQGAVTHRLWLDVIGNTPSIQSSYRLIRDTVITGVSVNSKNNTTSDIRIMKNTSTLVYEFSLSSEAGKSIDNLNVNLDKDDVIQVLIYNVTGAINYPVVSVEVAWR